MSVHSLLTQRLAASSGELSVGRGRERSEPGREGRQVGRVVGKDRERSWGTCRVGLCQQPSHTLPELSATSWVLACAPSRARGKSGCLAGLGKPQLVLRVCVGGSLRRAPPPEVVAAHCWCSSRGLSPSIRLRSLPVLTACSAACQRLLWAESALRETIPAPAVLCAPTCPHRSGHQGNGKVNVEQLQSLQTVEA